MELSRRNLIKAGGLGGLGLAAFGVPLGQTLQAKSASTLRSANFPIPYSSAFVKPPVLEPYETTTDGNGAPLQKFEVREAVGTAQIVRGGLKTTVVGYNGSVPGPTIHIDQGTKAVLKVRNQLPALHPQWAYVMDSSTHLHGSASLPQFDGYANDVTYPKYKKYYQFPNFQPARTLWYHDHAVHHTAHNVYSGLAAQYHLHDPVERALLPQDEFDVPVSISDAMFDGRGNLAWDNNSSSGLWGDVILVNGTPWPVMQVKRRVYRFRILNASISRSYRPRLSTGDAVSIVATDGGLMPVSRQVTSWRHAPAERYEVLIDFSKYPAGTRVQLLNGSNKNNIDYQHTNKIMAFDVIDAPVDTTDGTAVTIPQTLVSSEVMSLKASQATRTRKFRLQKNSAGIWTVGNQTWQEIVDSGFTKVLADPDLNAVEIWEFENKSGGWFHPLHIHLVDFQILSRNGRAPFNYEFGPKDVVYVGEGETVRLLMKFGPHQGRYMIHCHNLPHEDHDMMSQFSVGWKPGDPDPNDPLKAAQCVKDEEPEPND